ncbi:MAG: YciI family protein [Bacteroidales bacterium]
MKKLIFALFAFMFIMNVLTPEIQAQSTEIVYDSVLAKKLGADQYGMRNYYFVMLETGENPIPNQTIRDSVFGGHMANIGRLAEEGKLVLAGPFGKNKESWRGIFILIAADTNEVNQMLQGDPTVAGHYLKAVTAPWYGSAGLLEIPALHEKISKIKM